MAETGQSPERHDVGSMTTDAVLPDDIWPPSPAAGHDARVALVTGACGFLGRYVARELLQHTGVHLVCLARDKAGETAAARVARVFSGLGIGRDVLATRVRVVTGDLTEPELGLTAEDYADLAGQVDTIYHCAALVDWVRGYRHLARMNVGGVLAMIRFACHRRTKRLSFVSSIAVCYATGGPACVDEDTDMLPYIGGMPLGYARSKCVAESLLRQAGERGVPVTVLRPALIAGDSLTGIANPSDLIAALLQGCVATGMAIDADWLLDCVPVDFVARVMVQLPQGQSTWRVLNLLHPRPRHWRELILWVNLHGYPVRLVSSGTWVRHLFEEQGARGTLLYAQRQFFGGRPPRAGESGWVRPYEAYLAPGQARISSERTCALLDDLGLREPPLDAGLLHAYFAYYRRAGVLPPRAVRDQQAQRLDDVLGGAWEPSCGNGPVPNWAAAARTAIGGDDGLLKEIAAAWLKDGAGVWRLHRGGGRSADGHQPVTAVLKVKAVDGLVQQLSETMAGVCRPALGRLFRQYKDALGLTWSHERELALYELRDPRLVRHRPACYGTFRDPQHQCWALLLEYLPEADTRRQRTHLRADQVDMDAVLRGLVEIHAVGYGRAETLTGHAWLTSPPDSVRMGEMMPLWVELADFAAPWFETWCGPGIRATQADIIASLPTWWPQLQDLPVTLVHNDFNPRNFVVRTIDGERQLCVYDWELSVLGIPQHDLAELLCFTWHADMTERDLHALLEDYRAALSSASSREIDPGAWREGFALALRHLLINRLALYTLMHRFRPLRYLPGVMQNWMRLHAWAAA